MFTGLITDVGEVTERADGRFTLRTKYALQPGDVGLSICCDGVCLTATAIKPLDQGAEFTVDVSHETLGKTTLANWKPGRRVNLERSLRVGDELGGHIVSGHVDGVAKILDDHARRRQQTLLFRGPRASIPLHRAQGIDCAGRHLADRK